jgi:hypothetical protein
MSVQSKGTSSGGKSENQGEGNRDATRRYDEKLEKFVAERKSEIPDLAEDAERALDGPEGDDLRKAEEIGKAKAKR